MLINKSGLRKKEILFHDGISMVINDIKTNSEKFLTPLKMKFR